MQPVEERKLLISSPGTRKIFSDQGFWRKFFDAKNRQHQFIRDLREEQQKQNSRAGRSESEPFGLKNMLGNVMEYCADKYDPKAYSKGGDNVTNPLITEGEEWVVRGGNYTSDAA